MSDFSMYGVNIQNEQDFELDTIRIQRAGIMTLATCDAQPGMQISVVFTQDKIVRMLNAQHRDIDSVTDVLSFPASDIPTEIQAQSDDIYAGDLIIAYPYVRDRAEREQHDLSAALDLMIIHGTLHLMGYTHDTPENKDRMWQAQHNILTKIGIDPAIVTDLEDHS